MIISIIKSLPGSLSLADVMANSLILLPTFNEKESLPLLVPRLFSLAEDLEVLVIDDASPDGTGACAESLRRIYPQLSVLHRRKKAGLGSAYIYGFQEALRRGYGRIVTMDADLSHGPEDVPRLLNALDGAEVAVGSRHAPGGGVVDWPLGRRILSRAGSFYARALLKLPVSDVTSGFRAYRAEVLKQIDLSSIRSRGFSFQVEILRRILDLPGSRAEEVPIVFKNRRFGKSKLSMAIFLEAFFEVLKLAGRKKPVQSSRLEPTISSRLKGNQFPKVSVIVPVKPEAMEPEALDPILDLDYPGDKLEILVVRGESPARQRNLAARSAQGEYLLFLDDDSLPAGDLLTRYLKHFRSDPALAAAGGPAEPMGGGFGSALKLLFQDPWVMGKSASRYQSQGEARYGDERELILCNLCVKKTVFSALSGFNESLYPNEENELLERLRLQGYHLLYDPGARVLRHEKKRLPEFLRSIFSYGAGRGKQARIQPAWISLQRLILAASAIGILGLSGVGIFSHKWVLALPLLFYVLYIFLLAMRFSLKSGWRLGTAAAALVPLLHGSYSLGVVGGMICRGKNSPAEAIAIERIQRERFKSQNIPEIDHVH